ncbi:sugar ABC transporter substrate-binding protein [Paenibacillus sp. MY03]|jgi:putative aldouronate transport system substrate-binding protein|uniref:ABC transporter substrate-binding protein n=1 Tax=Paenibacillus sp. MY03 TaxID=302980 RepID=UPI000B3BFECE|nr:ABC transporter substrate-binding protein [Paenibacillus sp. MY03]OUS78105.1 sugar ABC transporter substrate-binding protein [Paenibacillus sp. MY03]
MIKESKKRAYWNLVLTCLMVISLVIAGCSSKGSSPENSPISSSETATDSGAESKIDTSEEVKLKAVFIGGKPVDYELVFEEINKKLKEKVNATLEAEFLDWSDYTQKYPLKFAAGEDFDMIYTANWAYYDSQAAKGGFLELTEELLSTYAPLTWEAMPSVKWDQARVNGKVYMIPYNNQKEFMNTLIMYREDLRQKYNLAPIDSMESLAAYMKAIAANEKGIVPFNQAALTAHEFDNLFLRQQNNWKIFSEFPLAYKIDDPSGQIFNVYETQQFKDMLVYYKDLADSGAWSRNVLTDKPNVADDFKAGKTAVRVSNVTALGGDMAVVRREKPEFQIALADLTPNSKKTAAISTQNGMAVHARSQNPERALMVMDLLQNDQELHDLILNGIPGTHFEPVGDTKLRAAERSGNFGGFSSWGFVSPLTRFNEEYPQEAQDIEKKWAEEVYHFDLETFVFDKTSVTNEVANVGNVMQRYAVPLEYGLVEDLEKGQAELAKQMKAAGLDKIKEELQKQIDAFLSK